MLALLRDAFGFSDRAERPPRDTPLCGGPEDGDREPVMLGGLGWPLTAIDPAGRGSPWPAPLPARVSIYATGNLGKGDFNVYRSDSPPPRSSRSSSPATCTG